MTEIQRLQLIKQDLAWVNASVQAHNTIGQIMDEHIQEVKHREQTKDEK